MWTAAGDGMNWKIGSIRIDIAALDFYANCIEIVKKNIGLNSFKDFHYPNGGPSAIVGLTPIDCRRFCFIDALEIVEEEKLQLQEIVIVTKQIAHNRNS